jgi:hypothetical protein
MIAGRYEELEDGLAHDTELGRTVRLRWLDSADEVDDPRLSHPNVVRVFDLGEHEGRRFAAIEHVHGLPLALVAPLPVEDAVVLGLQACRALAAAHDLGLVHAGEIVVRQDGVPKLSGFRRGLPGPDVQALATALNDAAPGLPPLAADTTTALALELERARPANAAPTVPIATVPSPTVPSPTVPIAPVRSRRRSPLPIVPLLLGLAVLAVAIGLIAAFAHSGDQNSGGQTPRQVAPVQPVPRGATAEQQAKNLAAWLSRYSR